MAVNKDKSITFVYWSAPIDRYEVKTVDNSVEYQPGMRLDTETVATLCADPEWHISACSVDLMHLIPFFGG
jgi:hypothetical protein